MAQAMTYKSLLLCKTAYHPNFSNTEGSLGHSVLRWEGMPWHRQLGSQAELASNPLTTSHLLAEWFCLSSLTTMNVNSIFKIGTMIQTFYKTAVWFCITV